MKYSRGWYWRVRACTLSTLCLCCSGRDRVLVVYGIKTNCVAKKNQKDSQLCSAALHWQWQCTFQALPPSHTISPKLPFTRWTQLQLHHVSFCFGRKDATAEWEVTFSDVRGFVLFHLGALRPRCGCRWAVGNCHCFCWALDGVVFIIHPQRSVDILILHLSILSSSWLSLCVCGAGSP